MPHYPCSNLSCQNKWHRSPICPNLPQEAQQGPALANALAKPPPPEGGDSAIAFKTAATKLRQGSGSLTTTQIPVTALNIDPLRGVDGRTATALELSVGYEKGRTETCPYRIERPAGFYLTATGIDDKEAGALAEVPGLRRKALLKEGENTAKNREDANQKVTAELASALPQTIPGYKERSSDDEPDSVAVSWAIPAGYERLAGEVYLPYPEPYSLDETGRFTALNMGYSVVQTKGSKVESVQLKNGKELLLDGVLGEPIAHLQLRDKNNKLETSFTLDETANSQNNMERILGIVESPEPASAAKLVFEKAGYRVYENDGMATTFSRPQDSGKITIMHF